MPGAEEPQELEEPSRSEEPSRGREAALVEVESAGDGSCVFAVTAEMP